MIFNGKHVALIAALSSGLTGGIAWKAQQPRLVRQEILYHVALDPNVPDAYQVMEPQVVCGIMGKTFRRTIHCYACVYKTFSNGETRWERLTTAGKFSI